MTDNDIRISVKVTKNAKGIYRVYVDEVEIGLVARSKERNECVVVHHSFGDATLSPTEQAGAWTVVERHVSPVIRARVEAMVAEQKTVIVPR